MTSSACLGIIIRHITGIYVKAKTTILGVQCPDPRLREFHSAVLRGGHLGADNPAVARCNVLTSRAVNEHSRNFTAPGEGPYYLLWSSPC